MKSKKHSMVIKCQSRATGKVLVVKRVRTRVCPSTGELQDEDHPDQGFPVRYLREVALLRATAHPNVMQLFSVSYHRDQLDVFSEFVGRNVEEHLAEHPPEAYEVLFPCASPLSPSLPLFPSPISSCLPLFPSPPLPPPHPLSRARAHTRTHT